jgi:hypothetical protein
MPEASSHITTSKDIAKSGRHQRCRRRFEFGIEYRPSSQLSKRKIKPEHRYPSNPFLLINMLFCRRRFLNFPPHNPDYPMRIYRTVASYLALNHLMVSAVEILWE